MKRLLIVNPTLGVGGVERKIADIARYLTEHPQTETEIHLLLEQAPPADAGENVFFEMVRQSPLQIYFQPKLPFFLSLLWQVLRFKPDTILAFSRRPSILALTVGALLGWQKIRVVLGNDTIASQALELYVPNPIPRRILKTHMQWLYPHAALILAPSETSKRDLIENFRVAPERIRVLKNWTPCVALSDVPKRFDLVYVGRVDRVKQLTRLMEITAEVRRALPHIRVVIVGDGNDMGNVRERTRTLGLEKQVEFVSFQTDVGSYLAQSKIFCLTSRFEGLPIAALEAMAYGLPVVTVAYAGAQELVANGETGFVCANQDAFGAAILRLLGDNPLLTNMGSRARQVVEREHGENVLAEYVNLVLNL